MTSPIVLPDALPPVRTNAVAGAQHNISSNLKIAKQALVLNGEPGVLMKSITDKTGIPLYYVYKASNSDTQIVISLQPYIAIKTLNNIVFIDRIIHESDEDFTIRLHAAIYG